MPITITPALATMADVANIEFVNALSAMDAEREAQQAANDTLVSLGIDGELGALHLVIGGGDRWMSEIEHRIGWVSPGAIYLWREEHSSVEAVRRAAVEEVVRVALTPRDPERETLADVVRREGFALSVAETPLPVGDLAAVRTTFSAHRAAIDLGTKVAFLYGDVLAETAGFSPLGISDHGGLAFAKALAVTKSLGPDVLKR